MKSGGPWNLRGLRPEARAAAREAARQSGMSVGEWLNSVIQSGDDQDDEPIRSAGFDDEPQAPRSPPRPEYRERDPIGDEDRNGRDRIDGEAAPSRRGAPYRDDKRHERSVQGRHDRDRDIERE